MVTRGFIMLIVLALLAVIALGVVVQLSMLQTKTVADLRLTEEEQSRAAAEACLSLLLTYTRRYSEAVRPGFEDFAPDFDKLLDPSTSPGDEHVLPDTTIVSVPAGANDAAHRFSFIDLGNDSACLARVDDNSDQNVSGSLAVFCINGPADDPLDDCDSTVVLTAIGLHPVRPGTAPASAYAAAHSRVGVRRVVARDHIDDHTSTGTGLLSGVAPFLLVSNDKVDLKEHVEVCGKGGVHAAALEMSSGACVCGHLVAPAMSPSDPPTTGCGCAACDAITVDIGAAPAPLDITIDPARWPGDTLSDFFAVSGLLSFFVRDGVVFVYDDSVDDDTDEILPGVVEQCDPGSLCDDFCILENGDDIPRPCDWTFNGTSVQPDAVHCRAGESVCWKPLARLDGVHDVRPSFEEHSRVVSGTERFAPHRTQRIPNYHDVTVRFDDVECPSCPAPGGIFKCKTPACDAYETVIGMENEEMPPGTYVWFDHSLTIQETGGTSAVSFMARVDGDVDIRAGASLAGDPTTLQPRDGACKDVDRAPSAALVVATGRCTMRTDLPLAGDIRCKSIDFDAPACMGSNSLFAGNGNVPCSGAASICIREKSVIGGLHAQDDIRVLAPDCDVGFVATNGRFIGLAPMRTGGIRAEREIVIRGNGDIDPTLSLNFTIKRTLTYMETTW